MNKFFFIILSMTSLSVFAVDGYYLGLGTGHTALTGKASGGRSNSIGFNLEGSIRANPILDVALNVHYSPHGGGLTIWGEFISANFHILEANDFDITIGAGPGFYTYKTADSETLFGLHAGVAGDLMLGDNLRLGLGARFHGVFSGRDTGDNFGTILARIGYFFPVE